MALRYSMRRDYKKGEIKMIYVEITEDSFIDAMNLAHKSKRHGFSHDGLKALFKYFKDEYYADYFELDPTWISREFTEYKNMNETLKENDMSDFKCLIHANNGSVVVQKF